MHLWVIPWQATCQAETLALSYYLNKKGNNFCLKSLEIWALFVTAASIMLFTQKHAYFSIRYLLKQSKRFSIFFFWFLFLIPRTSKNTWLQSTLVCFHFKNNYLHICKKCLSYQKTNYNIIYPIIWQLLL